METKVNTMEDDGDDKDDTKRRTRNLSEKKRRDQFNSLVNELSTLISTGNKKMDKTTVLKSAITFLKNHNEVTVRSRAHDVQEDWKPPFLANEEFTYLILEAMEGFILVFSGNGKIIYVSEGIVSLLGHRPSDVLNTSIFDLVPEIDRQHIYNVIHHHTSMDHVQLINDSQNEVQFQCHLKRGTLDFREETTYELIDFTGKVRRNVEPVEGSSSSSYQPHDQDSRLLFVCTGRLHMPQLIRDETLLDSGHKEFTSRHSLEWKFLFLDHRAPPIIGYLPFEVLGTSGYDYYHFDDLEKVINCHETLMQKGELTSCYYRFLTKGQQWIWLQTRYYITYHQWNSKPEFVVCTNRVVSYDDMSESAKAEVLEEEVSEVENSNSQQTLKGPPSAEAAVPQASPSYYSENNDTYTYHQLTTQPAVSSHGSTTSTAVTVGTSGNASASAAGNWPRELRRYVGSDCASVSGDSRSSQVDNARSASTEVLTPQHGIGVQYLEPMPYLGVGVSTASMMPTALLPTLPVIIDPSGTIQPSPSHLQTQEQLQRKHEKLQQMIMRQQEELRQVKEQLLLARLGMLQPIIPVQTAYATTEEAQLAVDPRLAAPIMYDTSRNETTYVQAPHMTTHMPHLPQ